MLLSVIISTYNSPEWLEKVLWAYECQQFKDFELLVADDGSTSETADLIYKIRNIVSFPIHHIWHEDKGFRKCEILNKAIIASTSEYLIFSDGDCIPRSDFLQKHNTKKKPYFFLSGGAVRLPLGLSKIITQQDINSQEVFYSSWLIQNGLKISFLKKMKLTRNEFLSEKLNKLTPTKATWNGGNSSGWKSDILAVNGFDERMGYGGEDRELGERLMNNGVQGYQIRYSAICIHLDHSRFYENKADLKRNGAIRKVTNGLNSTWTNYGIIKQKVENKSLKL